MASTDDTTVPGVDAALEHIAQSVFDKHLGSTELGSVGLEPEYLVFQLDAGGAPEARLPLEGQRSVLSALAPLLGPGMPLDVDTEGPPPVYTLGDGGRITFEPGAQVEHSTAVHPNAATAMEDVDRIALVLNEAFAGVQSSIASVGLDLWTDRSVVPQQLRAARYDSMAAYLQSRSEHGQVMMRHTGSFQVNLDLGNRQMAEERWRLANLLTPVALASFACSPEGGWASRRGRAWQGLDPTRTGFPTCLLAGERTDPGRCYADLALKADVLLFRNAQTGGAAVGRAGFRFMDWIEEGHPEHGSPTWDDLNYHLTTLFPEVRLRGFLEIRSTDAVPLHLRAAQVVFWCGLLYDAEARGACLELLEPQITCLQQDWVTAAHEGLANADLQRHARDVWRLALEGARRLPEGFFRAKDLRVTESFVQQYVERGRSPGDDLRDLLERDPAEALAWSIQPG